MKKYLNNSGYSLVFSIVALSIITGATAYLMNQKKVSVVESSRARVTSLAELEKSRIATALTDNTVCADPLQANSFFGKNSTSANILTIAAKGGATLVAKNAFYHNGIMQVSNISTRRMTASDPGYFAGAELTDNGWILQIDYVEGSVGNSNYSGKKSTTVSIPMYMKGGASITNCYALGQNEKIHIAIRDACSPATLTANLNNRNSTLNIGTGIESDCEGKVIFQDMALNETACIDSNVVNNTQTMALKGFNINKATGELTLLTDKCSGIVATCPGATAMWKIVNSLPSCTAPGFDRAAVCTPGQVLYKVADDDYRCVNADCTAVPDQFIASIGAAGAVCYQAPTNVCGANSYVKDFLADGTAECSPLPVMSANNCAAANRFGQNITRNMSTYDGDMSCQSTLAKACASPSRTNFVTDFNDTTTANCLEGAAAGVGCNVDGFSVPHLGTVTAYQSLNGNPCVSQVRTCNNGVLSGSYTNADCKNTCPTTTISLCSLTASNHNTYSGLCSSGYGSCNYRCNDGTWTAQTANTCSATPPPPCPAITDANCSLPGIASGSSTAGTCVGGTTLGSCNYSCSAGAWSKNTNTCRTEFDCTENAFEGCSLPTRLNGTSGGASCAPGLSGACNYSCVDGVDTFVSNSCSASCTQDGETLNVAATAATGTSFTFYNVRNVPFGNACPAGLSRTCDIVENVGPPITFSTTLNGDASYQYASCTPLPPSDCNFSFTSGTCTTTPTTSGSDIGTCIAGYTGTCSLACFNGAYTPGANNCHQNCAATSIANCDLGISNHGDTIAGSCASGYTGTCSYSCSDGAFSAVSNACVGVSSPCNINGNIIAHGTILWYRTSPSPGVGAPYGIYGGLYYRPFSVNRCRWSAIAGEYLGSGGEATCNNGVLTPIVGPPGGDWMCNGGSTGDWDYY